MRILHLVLQCVLGGHNGNRKRRLAAANDAQELVRIMWDSQISGAAEECYDNSGGEVSGGAEGVDKSGQDLEISIFQQLEDLSKSGEDNISGTAEGDQCKSGEGSSGAQGFAEEIEETQAWSDSYCQDFRSYIEIEAEAAKPVAMIDWCLYSSMDAAEKHIDGFFQQRHRFFHKGLYRNRD